MSTPRLTKIEEVDQKAIDEIVERILKSVDPEKILLFGSHAYGEPRNGSDLDLLVVMKSDLPRYKRAIPIYQALTGLLIPKDILVYTSEEIDAWSEVPQAFISTVMRKGQVIYEKK